MVYIHRHSSILRLDLFLYSAWLVSKQLTVLSTEVLFCCNHSELGIGSNFAWVSGEMHFAFGQSVCTVCVCVCVCMCGGGDSLQVSPLFQQCQSDEWLPRVNEFLVIGPSDSSPNLKLYSVLQTHFDYH